jgi:protein TonB
MDSRFLLPVTIATALHAFVLLGVKWPHLSEYVPTSKITPVNDRPFEVEIEKPDPVDEPDSVAPSEPKGAPENLRPTQEEPVARDSVFHQVVEPRTPSPLNVVDRIVPGPIGVESVGIRPGVTGIVSSDVLDNPPRTRSQISPQYPAAERNAGITGEVMVEFMVDETGRVQRAHALTRSNAAFESAAIRAVEKWRFEPGKRHGRPVRFRMAIPIHFSLDQSST